MREVVRVVQAICDLIPTGGLRPADRDLFITLVRWREQAFARLQEVVAALQTGDESRALQLSESEPRLPDFMAHLGLMSHMGLSEELKWKEYFRLHGIPVPPPLDSAAVQRLHDLYMRGITPGSPFYQEYLAAMKAGDEDRALTLLRSIVRLTRDSEARVQYDSLLRKKVAPQLSALRACLDGGQEDGVLAWLDDFEVSGAESILTDDPVFVAACAARRSIMSRRSTLEAGRFLEDAVAEAGKGNLPHVNAGIARIKRLHADWGIFLDPAQIDLLQKLEKYTAGFQAEAERRSKFNQALAILRDQSIRVHQVLSDGKRLTPLKLGEMQESLSGLQSAVFAFDYPVPQEDQVRLREIAAMLKEWLVDAERSRGLRSAALYVPLVMIVGGMLWLVYLHRHAHNQLQELAMLHDARKADAANQLLRMMLQSAGVWMLNLSDETKAKFEALQKWARLELERMQKVNSDIDQIELLLAAPDNEMSPEDMMKMLDSVRKDIKQLAPDYLLEMQGRFDTLQGRVDERFRILLAKNVLRVREILVALERLATGLDFDRPVSEVTLTLDAMRSKLKEVAPLEHPTVPALCFPKDVNTALTTIRGNMEFFTKELATFAEVKNTMLEAKRIEDYRQALIDCTRLRFLECRVAGVMLGKLPGEVEILARLFFSGDMKIWLTAAEQASGAFGFIPGGITPEEMRSLKALSDDPNLNAPGSAKKLTLASGLRDAVSSAPGRPAVPMLKVMDRVVRSSEGDVLAKAFIFQEIGRIMRARSADWGLHFCPELVQHFKKFDAILGKERIHSGDWNRPASRKKWQASLGRFFATAAEGRPFLEMGEAFRDRVAIAATGGLNVAGFVDGAREGHIKLKSEKSTVAWGFGEQGASLVPVEYESGSVPAAELEALRKWTPLFSLPMEIQRPGVRQAGK